MDSLSILCDIVSLSLILMELFLIRAFKVFLQKCENVMLSEVAGALMLRLSLLMLLPAAAALTVLLGAILA